MERLFYRQTILSGFGFTVMLKLKLKQSYTPNCIRAYNILFIQETMQFRKQREKAEKRREERNTMSSGEIDR